MLNADSWQQHIRAMAYRWLLGSRPPGCLPPAMLMLLGNPDRYRRAEVEAVLGEPRREGVFRVGSFEGTPLAFTTPRFGGPATAMYLEVAAVAGVRRVVALGYTGGLHPKTVVGTAFVAREALGLDGTTLAYQRGSALALLNVGSAVTSVQPAPDAEGAIAPRVWPADPDLSTALEDALDAADLSWTAGRMATIDAILLEDDALVTALAARGCAALDMETACLYAVCQRLGIAVSSVHLVSDSPYLRDVNPAGLHLAAYPQGLAVAARALLAR